MAEDCRRRGPSGRPRTGHLPSRRAGGPIIRHPSKMIRCRSKRSDSTPPMRMDTVNPSQAEAPKAPAWTISMASVARIAGSAVPRMVWKIPTIVWETKAAAVISSGSLVSEMDWVWFKSDQNHGLRFFVTEKVGKSAFLPARQSTAGQGGNKAADFRPRLLLNHL